MIRKFATIALLGLAALTSSGCSSTQWADFKTKIAAINNFAVTQSQLDGATATYNGTSLAALHRYALLPRCAVGAKFTLSTPCHDPAILKKWSQADLDVDAGFTKTQAQITAGNNSGAVAAWTLLQTALSTAASIATQSGVNALPL